MTYSCLYKNITKSTKKYTVSVIMPDDSNVIRCVHCAVKLKLKLK